MNDTIYGQLETAARRAYRRGIQTGSGGNLSARCEGGMIVKSSGGSFADCCRDGSGFVETDLSGNILEGRAGKPTREVFLHAVSYTHLGLFSIYFQGLANGSPIGSFDKRFTNFAQGAFHLGPVRIPYIAIYAVICTVIVWVIWNKTKIGKNMFAIGGNPEAAAVCGVNIVKGSLVIYILAGILYGFAGALEAGRTGSATNALGADYALDAIAACVVGGVSMRGGIGTIKGIVTGVIMFQIINYGLIFIGVSPYVQYAVKGSIILIAVAIDTQKYLKKK